MSNKALTQFTQIGDIGGIYGGKQFDRNLTIAEALVEGGLNWKVGMRPIYMDNTQNFIVVEDEGQVYRTRQDIILPEQDEDDEDYTPFEQWTELPDHVATYRDDNNMPLGIVGNRYVPVQNRDAFGWVENFLGKDIEYITTAGALQHGRRTFVCLDLGGFMVVEGDEVRRHLLVTNSHDGSSNLVFHILGARLACKNALNFAGRRTDATIKIRHSASAAGIIEEVSHVWGKVKEGFLRLEDIFGEMATTKISAEKHNAVIRKALGITDDQMALYLETQEDVRRPRWAKGLSEVEFVAEQWPGHEFGEGTLWGTYNALTGYYDHVRTVRGGDAGTKIDSRFFGYDASAKADALRLCVSVMERSELGDID